MKKIRIALVLITQPESGGSFQYAVAMLDAVAALDSSRYMARVFTREKQWQALMRERGLPGAWIPRFFHGTIGKFLGKLPISSWRAAALRMWEFAPLRLSMRAYRIELVIIPDQSSMPLPASMQQIACIHDLMHSYETRFPEVGNPEEYAARERLYATMLERCAAILVDSETGKQHVLESYAADPSGIFVLPYVVHDGLKHAVPTRPSSLPEDIAGRYLFYPAQFWLHKNHTALLEAVAHLRPEPDIRCVFSGHTNQNAYPAFRERVESLGLEKSIHCLGYVSEGELAWLYQHARCMIMPTFFGPTNIPPLEAMHFGCPVGISGIYGMPAQLGDAALYFDPHSVEDMMRVIRQLWTDETLRALCVQKGFAVAKAHSAERFSADLERILQQLAMQKNQKG